MVVRDGAAPWPLVGRERELDDVSTAWGDRRCAGLVIVGPAGVGKSRLAEECLARAVRMGFLVGRATASAAAATVPFGAIAHLVPVGVGLSDPADSFARVASALSGPTRRRWALMIDDLHLLDATSAVLMRQLLDAGVVRLIGTVRTGEPVGDAVDALCSAAGLRRLDLAELDQDQVGAVLTAVLRGRVARRAVHELFVASGGNLLYLRELVLGALAEAILVDDGEIWDLVGEWPAATPALVDLVRARLAAVDPEGRRLLELLALSEPVSLADGRTVLPRQALSELRDAGLIRITTDRRRTELTLAHPLHAEVLRAEIPTLRRRALLLEHAGRIESHGIRRRDDALHVAACRLAATGTADPGVLVQAARLARQAHDYRQAAALLRAVPAGDHTTESRLLLASALIETGRFDQAEAALSGLDATAADEQEHLAALISHSLRLFATTARTAQVLALTDAARRHVTSAAGRRLLGINEGIIRTVSGEPVRGLALLDDLDDDVRRAGELNVWLLAAMIKSLGLSAVGRTADAFTWAERVHAAHLEVRERVLLPPPASQLSPLIVALAECGRITEARAAGEPAFATLVVCRVTAPGVWPAFHLGRVEWLAGHPAAARRWYAEAAALARSQGYLGALRLILSGLAAAAALLGDTTAAGGTLTEATGIPATGYLAGEERLGEAWSHAAHGRLAQARRVLTEAAGSARDTGHLTSEALLLTDVARLGGARLVAERLGELGERCDGALASARARLAGALAADAPDALLAAAADLERIGADLLAAEAAAAAATAWRRRGRARRAVAAAGQAAAWTARCEGARSPLLAAAGVVAVLTARENEVALLAAAGTASRDIAQALRVSVRTVDNHLHRAYAKLGVANRRELTERLSHD